MLHIETATPRQLSELLEEPILALVKLANIKERIKALKPVSTEGSENEEEKQLKAMLKKMKDQLGEINEAKTNAINAKQEIKKWKKTRCDLSPEKQLFFSREDIDVSDILKHILANFDWYQRFLFRAVSKEFKKNIDAMPLNEFLFYKDQFVICTDKLTINKFYSELKKNKLFQEWIKLNANLPREMGEDVFEVERKNALSIDKLITTEKSLKEYFLFVLGAILLATYGWTPPILCALLLPSPKNELNQTEWGNKAACALGTLFAEGIPLVFLYTLYYILKARYKKNNVVKSANSFFSFFAAEDNSPKELTNVLVASENDNLNEVDKSGYGSVRM